MRHAHLIGPAWQDTQERKFRGDATPPGPHRLCGRRTRTLFPPDFPSRTFWFPAKISESWTRWLGHPLPATSRNPRVYYRASHSVASLLSGTVIPRSEEHTSELTSLMLISYAVSYLIHTNT